MITTDDRWGCKAPRVIRRLPRGELADYVASLTVIDRDDEGRDHIFALPDGQATLLFCIRGGTRLSASGKFSHADGHLHVLGAATKGYSKPIEATPLSIVLRFKTAGAYRFLRSPMHCLSNEDVALCDLWGRAGHHLKGALIAAASTENRLDILERFLCAQLERSKERDLRCVRRVSDAITAVRRMGAWSRSAEMHDDLAIPGASTRHLRRLFNDVVGVSPHTLIRIERFNYAVQLARSSNAPLWGDIAARAGYYDQAHMIMDFKHFVDVTPHRFLYALQSGLPHLKGSWFNASERSREYAVSASPAN
jgi:AraC-like DNA-binding protein